jgi:cytochrome b561
VVVVAGLTRLRNGPHGYGPVTKVLHWLTVAVIVAQFAVGAAMGADEDALDREKDRIDALEEEGEERAEQQGEAAEERFENEIDRLEDELDAREDNYVGDAFGDIAAGDALDGGLALPELHALFGLSLIVLGVLRIGWRAVGGLPPWADHLSAGERRLESALEKLLLTMLFVVPATGLFLIVAGDDWLALHVAAQVVLLAAIAVHVGLVLKHTVVQRNRHLSRMT